jgi:hypothetical protein
VDRTPNQHSEFEEPSLGLDSSLSVHAIREELKRILVSRTFRAAHGQRKFLAYTVEKAIAGDGHLIKEYVIGTEAFGRDQSFDPRLDSIVRTEARKLRTRLAKYYETEGKGDPLHICFRKGSYVPFFCEVGDPCLGPAAKVSETSEPSKQQLSATELDAEGRLAHSSGQSGSPVASAGAAFAVAPLMAKLRSPLRTILTISAVAVLAISAFIGYFLYHSRLPESVLAANNASIAVLPLVNLGDRKDEFFSDDLPKN